MITENGWKVHYQPLTQELSSSYKAFDIYQLAKEVNCTGRKDFIDGELYDGLSGGTPFGKAGSGLTDIRTGALYTTKDFNNEATASQDFTNFKRTLTPFTPLNDTLRIAVTSRLIEAGYSFKRGEESLMMAGASPDSKVYRSISTMIRRKKATMFIQALASQSVRKSVVTYNSGIEDYEDIESDLTIPDDRKFTTKYAGYIALEDLTTMRQKTVANMTNDEQWYVLISSAQRKAMIDNSYDEICNKDFVDGGSLLDVNLPRLQGFTFIEHPLMDALYPDNFFAFTKTAIAQANFLPLDLNVGTSADHRFQTILYYSQNLDYKCIDFGKIIQGAIQ